jgi:SAM-dependent methyltransferase
VDSNYLFLFLKRAFKMHLSAWNAGCTLFSLLSSLYSRQEQFRILDIGSYNVNGELRSALQASTLINFQNVVYTGMDIEAGPNVDIVVPIKAKNYPFPAEHFQAVISSSALEHDPHFWMTYLKMLTVLAPGGILYISVPNFQDEHRFPVDCWRFYGDAGEALASWGRENDFKVDLAFSGKIWQGAEQTTTSWRDYVMIFYKRHEGDSDDTVSEVVDYFSDFVGAYERTLSDNIFAVIGWSLMHSKHMGQRSICKVTDVTAPNGTAYALSESCEFTRLERSEVNV